MQVSCALTVLMYYTVLYCTILYCTVLYCTVLYCAILYCTILYCTVLYCTIQSLVNLKQALRVCAAFRGCYLDFRDKAEGIVKSQREALQHGDTQEQYG